MRRTAQLLRSLLSILLITAGEGIQFLWLAVSSRTELRAEVLFLRKQLAFYREHLVPPRKLTDAARFSLVLWSHLGEGEGTKSRFNSYPQAPNLCVSPQEDCRSPESPVGEVAEGTKDWLEMQFDQATTVYGGLRQTHVG